jgi:integrase
MSLRLEPIANKSNNTVLLRFAYTHGGVRRYFKTGVRIPMDQFNPKSINEPVRSGHKNRAHLNRLIKEVYDQIMDIRTQVVRDNVVPTADAVASRFREATVQECPSNEEDPIVHTLIDRFLEHKKQYNKRTIKLYRVMINQFAACFGDLRLSQFDLLKWNQFEDYLLNKKGKALNTVNIRMKKLKSFLRSLRKDLGLKLPFEKFKLPPEEIKRVSLDPTEVTMIMNYVPAREAMQAIKDLCIFQCFTGLRISDLTRLDKLLHIRTKDGITYIDMISIKTGLPMTIPLFETAMEILIRYDFKLPVVAEQYYNRELKKLIQLAGIDRRVDWVCKANGTKTIKSANLSDEFTNHCCGRSAIEFFFSKGYTPPEVVRIVGKSLTTIMKYYLAKSTGNSIIEKARRIGGNTEGTMLNAA